MTKEEQALFEVQKEKEAAISAGDFEQAKKLQARQQELEKELEQIRKRFERRCKSRKLQVTEEEIAKTVSTWTKIPVQRLAEGESKRLARLEQTLHKRVVGQEEAVAAVAKAVKRGRIVRQVRSCSWGRPVSEKQSFPRHSRRQSLAQNRH